MSIVYAKTATLLDTVPSSNNVIHDFACLRVASGNVSRGDMLGYELNGKIHSLGTIKTIMHRGCEYRSNVNPSMGDYLMLMIMDDGKTLHWRSIPQEITQLMVVIPVKAKCVMKYLPEEDCGIYVNMVSGHLDIGDVLSFKLDEDSTCFYHDGCVLGTHIQERDLDVDAADRMIHIDITYENDCVPSGVFEAVVLNPTKPNCEIFIDEDGHAQVNNGSLHVGDVLMTKHNKNGNTYIIDKVLSITVAPPSNPIQSTDEPIRFIIEMKDGSVLQKNQTYFVLE